MADFEIYWVKILIAFVFIVIIILWGRFMSRFKIDRKGGHTFHDEWEAIRRQLGPRYFKVFATLFIAGVIVFISIRLFQLLG